MKRSKAGALVAGTMLVLAGWAWLPANAAAQSTGQQSTGQQGTTGPGGMTGPGGTQGGQGGLGPTGPGGTQLGPGGRPGFGPGPGYGPGGPGYRMRFRGGSIFERPLISEILSQDQQLGLSQDQVQRLQSLRSSFEKQAIKLQADIRSAEIDLSDLLAVNPPDMAKVEAQVNKIASLQAQMRLARIRTLQDGRAVLSPEQWQKFQAMVPNTPMGRGRYGMRGYGRGMGPGMMGGGYGMGPGMMGSGGMMGRGY